MKKQTDQNVRETDPTGISIDEIVNDYYFTKQVQINIDELRIQRQKRVAKPGYYFKRDWYDRLREQNNLTGEYFVKHIPDIWRKKSNLPSAIRVVIKYVCDKALFESFDHFNKLEKFQNITKATK
jgi:hypothetical protein